MTLLADLRLLYRRLHCLVGRHDWRDTNYPAWLYFDIASYAGTKNCRHCRAFRLWTSAEEAPWLR